MWYIDGHHETLAARSCSVLPELSHIQGYNKPETHGHKRKSSTPLKQPKIMEHSLSILHLTQQSYMKQQGWSSIREVFLRLASNLRKYAEMLLEKVEKSQAAHSSKKSFFETSEKSSIKLIRAMLSAKPTIVARYKSLNKAMASSDP